MDSDSRAYDRDGIRVTDTRSPVTKPVGVGFEPTVPFGTPVFKTGSFSHSDTLPGVFGPPPARAASRLDSGLYRGRRGVVKGDRAEMGG